MRHRRDAWQNVLPQTSQPLSPPRMWCCFLCPLRCSEVFLRSWMPDHFGVKYTLSQLSQPVLLSCCWHYLG